MKIESIFTILSGIANTLEIIKDHPQLKDLEVSQFYATSNDLVFADIQLADHEVLDGLLQANTELENQKDI